MSLEGFRDFYRRYSKNRPAVAGLYIILFMVIVSIFAEKIAPYDYYELNADEILQPPSAKHWMGTNNLGRDILSGILVGSQISLFIGFMSTGISAVLGTLVGAVAGYYGGNVDSILMRITELFIVMPTFFLILIVIAFFGSGIWNVMFIIGITSWSGTARLVRSEILSLKNQEFIEAARATGASDLRILSRHIIPNAVYPVIVSASMRVGGAISLESGLSFLGLGDPNHISWGQLLTTAQRYMRVAWWVAAFPGLAILLGVLSFNLIGDGMNDALNPKLRKR